MKQVEMIALDVLHVSNAQPSELVADARFTINEAEAEQLKERGLAKLAPKAASEPSTSAKPATAKARTRASRKAK